MPRTTLVLRVLVAAVLAASVPLIPAGAQAYAAVENYVTGTVNCDLDTGFVHATWSYTNALGPAVLADVSMTPADLNPQITTTVPVGDTVVARASFRMDTEQVTFNFTVVGDGWSTTHSSPVVPGIVCPKTQVVLSYSHQCDTSLVVTMRNKPFATHGAELTIERVVPAGGALGPFIIAPGQQRSVTVPLPTTYVRVFEGSIPIGGNSGPRPTPCAPTAPAAPHVAGQGSAPSATAAASTSATAATNVKTGTASAVPASTSARPTPALASSASGSGATPWAIAAAVFVVTTGVLLAFLRRHRSRKAVDRDPA